MRRLCFFLSLVLLVGCATPRKSRLSLMGGAAVAGLAIGSSSAPADERQELHAMYWAGLLGLAAAVAGEYLYADEDVLTNVRLENEKLKTDLELINSANKVLLKEGKGYFKNSSGENLFPAGKARWRLYQIDKWEKDGPNRLYHQDRMMEVLPLDGSN